MKYPINEYTGNRLNSQYITREHVLLLHWKFNSYMQDTSWETTIHSFLKYILPSRSDRNNLPFDEVTGPYEENLQTERAQRK